METIFAEEAVSEMAVCEGVAIDRETEEELGRSRWVEGMRTGRVQREESARSRALLRFPA